MCRKLKCWNQHAAHFLFHTAVGCMALLWSTGCKGVNSFCRRRVTGCDWEDEGELWWQRSTSP